MYPRGFLGGTALLLGAVAAHRTSSVSAFERPAAEQPEQLFWVGGADYGAVPSNTTHIHGFVVDADGIRPKYRSVRIGPNPSWLCYDGFANLYACLESVDAEDIGGVAAIVFDEDSGAELLNAETWPTKDHYGPAHCMVDQSGAFVLAANYAEGQLGVFPVGADRGIGKGIVDTYASGSHAHCVTFTPNQEFVYVTDLGLDRVHGYKWNARTGNVAALPPTTFEKGTAPRHMVFSRAGKFALLLTESTSLLIVLELDSKTGALTERSRTSILPPGWNGINHAAEVVLHPSQRVVFVSNRGHDSITKFAFDASTGAITVIGWEQRQISTPRGLELSPDGKYMIVANQNGLFGDKIVGFEVEGALAGSPKPVTLLPIGTADVPSPTTIAFV